MTKFWMVWRMRGGEPTKQHWSEDAAKQEAERLAREYAGQVFYVLEMTAACKLTSPVLWREAKAMGEHPHGCQCDDCTIPF